MANPFTRPTTALTNSATLEDVKEALNWLLADRDNIDNAMGDHEGRLIKLRNDVDNLDVLESKNESNHDAHMKNFNQAISSLNSQVTSLQTTIAGYQGIIQQLQNQLNSLPQTATVTTSKPLGVNKPSQFTGKDWSQLPIFKNQVLTYIGTKRPHAPATEKVKFVISYLQDEAANWIQPFLTQQHAGNNVGFLNDFDCFWEEMEKRFGEPDKKQSYRNKYRALQHTGTVQEFLRDFLGYSNVLGYSDQDLRDTFYDKLKKEIKETMMVQNFDWENMTFQQVADRALKINSDRAAFNLANKLSGGGKTSGSTSNTTSQSTKTASTTRTLLAPGNKVYKNEKGVVTKGTIARIAKVGGMQTLFVTWSGSNKEEQSSFRTIKRDNEVSNTRPYTYTSTTTTTTSSKPDNKGPVPMELDGKGKGKLTCHICGGRGHFANVCPSKPLSGHEAEIESETDEESGKGNAQTF